MHLRAGTPPQVLRTNKAPHYLCGAARFFLYEGSLVESISKSFPSFPQARAVALNEASWYLQQDPLTLVKQGLLRNLARLRCPALVLSARPYWFGQARQRRVRPIP